jgi:hypothetical protein
MGIRKEDLVDLDIVDAVELASDGYYVYLTGTLVSTTTGSNLVTINLPFDGEGLITGRDHPLAPGDRIRLTGTSGGLADGYYLVNLPISDTSFSVTTSIATSTGGNIYFMFREGARQVGFDPTGLLTITAHNVQDAIREVAYSATGISEPIHKTLRHIIHFIDDGPGDGFLSGSYKEILPLKDPFPTSVIWWESSAKIKKLLEKAYTYNANKTVSQAQWKIYDTDGSTVLTTVTDTIVYSGVFELNRTRSFS